MLQDMSKTPGVLIEDMGHKMGCNGVDNAKLTFHSAPWPAHQLLTAGGQLWLNACISECSPIAVWATRWAATAWTMPS